MINPDLIALIDAVREDTFVNHHFNAWFICAVKETRTETKCSLKSAVHIVRCYVYVKHLEGDKDMVTMWDGYGAWERSQALQGLFGDIE